MRLIPVIDILNGVVVHGVAGQRDRYQPIISALTSSSEPLEVARAIRKQYGLSELYVADLDAIISGHVQTETAWSLVQDGFELLIDAGIENRTRARQFLGIGTTQIIVGLESCHSPRHLREIIEMTDPDRVIFSLDLKQGKPLTTADWDSQPLQIAKQAIDAGIRRMIVLDVAGVGIGKGVPTVSLCSKLRHEYGSSLQLITGGGVRGVDDLIELEEQGIHGALIASVLHQMPPPSIGRWTSRPPLRQAFPKADTSP